MSKEAARLERLERELERELQSENSALGDKSLKEVKEVKEVQPVINANEKQALETLITAIKIAQSKGAFELDDAVIIGNAKNVLQGLIN